MQQTENLSIREFEYHRKNLNSKKGLISKVEPINKKEIKIKYKLHYGDEDFSEIIKTKDIPYLLEHVGLDKHNSIKELENKDIDLKYRNNEWEIDKSWVEDMTVEKTKYKSIHRFSKIAHLIGTILAIYLYIIMITNLASTGNTQNAILFGLCGFIIHTMSGFIIQHTSYIVVKTDIKKYDSLAPVARKAYTKSTSPILTRIFHALTLHL